MSSFEEPKNYTPEEMAEIEKGRTITDAQFLESGSEYKFDEKGRKSLLLTEEQLAVIKERYDMSDEKTVLEVVKKSSGSLEFADLELRAKPNVVLAAIKKDEDDAWTFQFATQELQGNKEFVLKAVKQNPAVFEYVRDFKKDPEVRKAAGLKK